MIIFHEMLIKNWSFIIVVLFLLSSCSTVRYDSRDGIPYEKTYAVASWYGSDFHGRPTSSGEIYNMYAKTCAHKEYPFGTQLRVTSVATSLAVECTVNDRGPFIAGRDIDLSYASAREIGLIRQGVGKVVLEVTGRNESYVRAVKIQPVSKTGPFAIQVGAFTENLNAVRLKAGLSLKYDQVYIQEIEINGTRYYRVRIGNFELLNNAVSVAEQLGQEGYPTLVTKAEL